MPAGVFRRTQRAHFRRGETEIALSLLNVTTDNDQVAPAVSSLARLAEDIPSARIRLVEKLQTRFVLRENVTDQRLDSQAGAADSVLQKTLANPCRRNLSSTYTLTSAVPA